MYFSITLKDGVVYLPTMGKMDRGFYRGIEPVAVVSATNTELLREALLATIARGNPSVPMLKRRDWPPPVVLKYAGVKKWSAFERGMILWSIEGEDGKFQIAVKTKQSNGMWVDDKARTIELPNGSKTQNVVERMVAIIQQAASPKS